MEKRRKEKEFEKSQNCAFCPNRKTGVLPQNGKVRTRIKIHGSPKVQFTFDAFNLLLSAALFNFHKLIARVLIFQRRSAFDDAFEGQDYRSFDICA